MNRRGLAFAICLLGVGLSALPATAQELTEDEIVDRFRQQKTRGLAIAPVSQTGGAAATAGSSVIAGTAAAVRVLPEEQQVNLNISFDFDSAALRDDQKPRLSAMCSAMKTVDGEQFVILGHTDASGSETYNQRLSLLRAQEVKRYLVSESCGIASERLEAMGVGEQFPFDPDDPRADVNRRVEFQVNS